MTAASLVNRRHTFPGTHPTLLEALRSYDSDRHTLAVFASARDNEMTEEVLFRVSAMIICV